MHHGCVILSKAMQPVRVDASRTNRSLVAAAQGANPRPQLTPDLPLLMYRRLIDLAVAGAKKVKYGLPTHQAILDRHWLQEWKPPETDKEAWRRSFECACHWLGLNADEERKRLVEEIDEVVTRAIVLHAGSVVYGMRAAVLACAGIPTRIGRQFQLGLVSVEDYEQIALIEHPDPPARKLPRPARPRSARSAGGRSARRVLPAS